MKINTIGYSAVGKRHLSVGQANQDCFKVYEDERILSVVLSDGASGAEDAARPAAVATVAGGIEFTQNGKIWNMNNKQLTDEVLRVIDNHYLASEFPYDRLCSTMVLLTVNKISRQYIAMLIGDCCLMLLNKEFEPSILLSPVNYFSKRNTLFVNSSGASRFIKIERGSLDNADITGFILNTDGAEDLLSDSRNDDICRISALTVIDRETAESALQECVSELSEHNPDDITAAFVMVDNDDTRRVAAAELGEDYDGYITGEDSGIHESEEEETAGTEEYNNRTKDQETAETDGNTREVKTEEPDKSTLLGFLASPRTAEELVLAGFVSRETELLTVLYPYLRDKLVVYKNHRFSAMKG
jgi:hypothetical protein